MTSIRQVYKIGYGPSSSHTMGPAKAAELFKEECIALAKKEPEKTVDRVRVILYGSLAKTGKGHKTDTAITQVLSPIPVQVEFDTQARQLPHENTMDFLAYCGETQLLRRRVQSIGGGDIVYDGRAATEDAGERYAENTFSQIASYCRSHNLRLWQYVYQNEGEGIAAYLAKIWATMQQAIADGLSARGILDGGLFVQRRAQQLYNQRHMDESASTYENRVVCAYAFAVSEQNAAAGRIVTAPTCGASGVLPAVLLYYKEEKGYRDEQILHALATAGLIGLLVKTNASVSGAECGCQAEVGTACAMASAGLCELFGMGLDQIEYAAEVAIEHHLGLTCDPICGLVQIPCIERNAVAAMRAINAATLANFLTFTRKISFDLVVKTMYDTGKDMNRNYRETSDGGLAKLYTVPESSEISSDK